MIPVATRAYRVRVAVATVQFSRAAERAAGAGRGTLQALRERTSTRRAAGLSKLNSMHPLVIDGMPIRRGQVRSTC